jgi:NAD(P)-dependent dehydrogenase (short-subunit alcohol dehydrogenase family)
MIANGTAYIVDTASSLCILPNPDAQAMLPYMASKGAILGVAYALRYSLQRRGIAYSVFCPGLTDTRPTHEQPIAARAATAAPASFAASVLLAGIQRGEFLISSEPDFASAIVRFAQNQLDPLSTQQR